MLLQIFKEYGNVSLEPFSIEKAKIEKILSILSIEYYHPSSFEFQNEIVTYPQVISELLHKFGELFYPFLLNV